VHQAISAGVVKLCSSLFIAESVAFLYTKLIEQQLTSTHTPHQNGFAQRFNRTIEKAAVVLLCSPPI